MVGVPRILWIFARLSAPVIDSKSLTCFFCLSRRRCRLVVVVPTAPLLYCCPIVHPHICTALEPAGAELDLVDMSMVAGEGGDLLAMLGADFIEGE